MPPATKQTPEEQIAELKEQLSLSDQGVSKLAQRCLALEQQLAQLEKHESYDNMSLFRLTLYYDCGLGFSEQDTIPAPVSAYSAANHTVSAVFELPREAKAIRLDPGELPCYVVGMTISDERIHAAPVTALSLDEEKTLFLNVDPQFYAECPERLPAGTKFSVSYTYYPLQLGADDTVFFAMRRGIEQVQDRAAAAAAAADEQRALAENFGEQLAGQERRAAHLEEQLAAAIAEKEHFRVSYEAVLSSACWKLTAPLRAFLGRKK
ncbi:MULTISPECIES: hypothetical protein [unclassified Faecalibacterium]|uniref:hypothetical protein n=1 Tax=unclassified Faecalibacterium TaxID=2646395 RepID=UPI000B3A8C3B|nr:MULTISPECIES: hypothetical protein [unclassified Faecalibacterium]OUP27396.1 hypothetical protein B5F27_10200 [Faecalibacterium sp. An192]OUQ37576.1 hypothetical protein B5E67_07630 [Faecalibacterium sp. An122]